ncbi:hypothetical protein NliqN6_4526 [Naganishia liquefaciens]|uniref:Uncharacterized protein n=1 Tax=Naganishia liquefaciens TaxID=104408 RepID=A0A8H3TW22_9TREE|nr:hypothetical protein NliqN6_4526 [Naganishia liquefaciens]
MTPYFARNSNFVFVPHPLEQTDAPGLPLSIRHPLPEFPQYPYPYDSEIQPLVNSQASGAMSSGDAGSLPASSHFINSTRNETPPQDNLASERRI